MKDFSIGDCYEVNTMVKTGMYSDSKVSNVIKLLNDIHFLALNTLLKIQLGSDIVFWYHYTQFFKQVILKINIFPPSSIENCLRSRANANSKSMDLKFIQPGRLFPINTN